MNKILDRIAYLFMEYLCSGYFPDLEMKRFVKKSYANLIRASVPTLLIMKLPKKHVNLQNLTILSFIIGTFCSFFLREVCQPFGD
jgi:hypothetical protein